MDQIVKNLNFGEEARDKVFAGVEKLTNAVKSTLGAGGKCVMLEDNNGRPLITKDGVTVAENIILLDPVENMGATLIKEASKRTVQAAGDGTTTATVLAYAILDEAYKVNHKISTRDLKQGIERAVNITIEELEKNAKPVNNTTLSKIATISANNDSELGKIIADAFLAAGDHGVVIMEPSTSSNTEYELVEGMQYDKGLINSNFITNPTKRIAELNNPLVLVVDSEIKNIRQIQSVLEFAIKNKESLLIIGDMDPSVVSVLAMNKIKGNIKVNVINAPAYGVNKKDTLEDIALITGAKVINEDLGDTMDVVDPDFLGRCVTSVTYDNETIIKVDELPDSVKSIINEITHSLSNDKLTPAELILKERRLARLSGKVAVVKVGASSEIELKEKADRVEDAICATKAAIKEGYVDGGGVALRDISNEFLNTYSEDSGYGVLFKAIKSPYNTILENAGFNSDIIETKLSKGVGVNVLDGVFVNMDKAGIIDPLTVTKEALKNAASVAVTILSTDCVINNLRIEALNGSGR